MEKEETARVEDMSDTDTEPFPGARTARRPKDEPGQLPAPRGATPTQFPTHGPSVLD